MSIAGNISSRLSESTAQQLVKLMRQGAESFSSRSDDDLSAILRYQLAYPLSLGLKRTGKQGECDKQYCREKQTFLQLLTSKSPDIDLLKEVRSYAKACRCGDADALASPVATILYYAAIAAALIHCDTRITTLSDRELQKGLEWSASRSWVDSGVKEVLQSALAGIKKIKETKE